ncbi:hypothetical protein ACIBG6_36695 [Streptomyces sp. NPDC050842]|uniref:hypothetical protein n=1 Tax=Streptomyces sp. NPDC050842 TaxID=3365636 RepID=UPI0037B77C0F
MAAGFGGDEVARARRTPGEPPRTPVAPPWCGERVRDLLGDVNTAISPATVAPETALIALEVATPTTGTVTWDDTDLAEADPTSVWSKVGLVPQDYTRWPMDLRANIHLGQPRTSDDTPLLHAARAADGADSKAAVFVTHNLENARIADRIVVLDGGRIVESGTFESLLDAAGLFAELYKLSLDR